VDPVADDGILAPCLFFAAEHARHDHDDSGKLKYPGRYCPDPPPHVCTSSIRSIETIVRQAVAARTIHSGGLGAGHVARFRQLRSCALQCRRARKRGSLQTPPLP
jgi:hypothetical protein